MKQQSSLNTASSAIKRNERRAATISSEAESKIITTEKLEKLKAFQANIDKYNNEHIYQIDPDFINIKPTGDYIIARLFLEDFVKFVDDSNPDDIQVDAWHRQIDARMRATDKPHWVSTPFPYIHSGVIVAVSPELQLKYIRMRKELVDTGVSVEEAAELIHMPQVGDVINIRPFESAWFKERRWYKDKQAQCKDFVRNQEELRLNNFQHYFAFESYDLESFVLNTPKKGAYYNGQSDTDQQ